VVYTSVAIRNATRFRPAGREVDLRAGLYHTSARINATVTLQLQESPLTDEPTLVVDDQDALKRACANMTRSCRSRRAAGDPLRSLRTHIRDQLGGCWPAAASTSGAHHGDHGQPLARTGYAAEHNSLWEPETAGTQRPQSSAVRARRICDRPIRIPVAAPTPTSHRPGPPRRRRIARQLRGA